LHDSTPRRQLAAAHPDGVVSCTDAIELTEEPETFDETLGQLEASTQKLRFENLELRLRLQRRKSRAAFERKLLLITGLSLLLLGLLVGLFLGLVVGSR
jgi:hypothetical protein